MPFRLAPPPALLMAAAAVLSVALPAPSAAASPPITAAPLPGPPASTAAAPGAAGGCAPCGMRAPQDDEVALVSLEDRRGPVEAILPYLDAAGAPTRARACLALGRVLGPLEADRAQMPVQRRLAGLLRQDPDPAVRRAAAFALGLLQSEPAGVALAATLAAGAEPDPLVRALAAEGLGRCDPGRHPAALARALEDPASVVVEAALLAVWKGAQPEQIPRVLALSAESDGEIRWRAAYALMRLLGAPPSGRTPVPGGEAPDAGEAPAMRERMLALADDPDLRVRLQSLRALGRWPAGDPGRAAAEEALLRARSDEDPRLRVEAARSLGALLAGSERLEAIAPLLADPHAHVRVTAIEAAGRVLSTPPLIQSLAAHLSAESPWERAAAVTALTQSACAAGQYEQARHLIERAASDPAWSVRYAAAEGLVALMEEAAPSAALDELRGRFLADDRRVAKACVVDWLSRRPPSTAAWPEITRDAERYLTSDDEVERTLGIEGLRTCLAAEGARPLDAAEREALLRRLDRLRGDPSHDVRAALAELARSLGDSTGAIAALAGNPGAPSTDYTRALRTAERARYAILTTAGGDIEVELFGADAPLTVQNFVRLAEEGAYEGGVWHRVVPDFVAQDGCPRGDGWGGPPWTIRCEINAHTYSPGTLGMALSGKDTGGSQFFLTLSDQPHLDGRYTIFGRVTRGMEILLGDGIRQAETPIERIRIRHED